MSERTADLIAFLRARLDEDELVANLAHEARPGPWGMRGDVYGVIEIYSVPRDRDHGRDSNVVPDAWHNESTTHIVRWDPARVLAEVAAKRALLAECEFELARSAPRSNLNDFAWTVLRGLGEPYADHPGCRDEWRLSGS